MTGPTDRTEMSRSLVVKIYDHDVDENVTTHIDLLCRKCFAIIPSRSRRTMWAKYILKLNSYEWFQSKKIE